MTKFESLLEEEMKLTGPLLLSVDWEDKEAYAAFLAQTYEMVCYSIRLVALSGAWTSLEDEYILDRCVDHAFEERGHPKLCVTDAAELGYELAELEVFPESTALYQIQYYQIFKNGGASFFGYSQFLETMAERFGGDVYERVKGAHGAKASKFWKVHAVGDVDHTEEGRKTMSELTEKQEQVAIDNMHLVGKLYRNMLSKLIAVPNKGSKAA